MAENHSVENLKGEADSSFSQRKDMKFLKGVTLIALIPLWAGYAFSLYTGNSSNLSNYSLLILAFSLINFNALCGVEKIKNRAFNLLARIEGVLFFVWAFITIIQLLVK